MSAREVGVTYFPWGISGEMTGYSPPRWRLRGRAARVAALPANVAVTPTFTAVGQLSVRHRHGGAG